MIFRKKTPLDNNFEHRHISDVFRIQQVCEQNGYEADLQACAYLWDEYSDSYAAGWLGMPESDDDLWSEIISQAMRLNYVKGFDV